MCLVAILLGTAGAVGAAGCDSAKSRGGFVDSDGDGLSDADEIASYGTSPLLADTDGDGISDFDEIVQHEFNPARTPHRFNPRVADLPNMELRVLGAPLLTLRLTTSDGESWTYTTSRTIGYATTWSATLSETDSFSSTFGVADTLSKTASYSLTEYPAAPKDAGADADDVDSGTKASDTAQLSAGPSVVTIADSNSSTVNRADTTGVTLSFSATEAQQLSDALTYAQSYSQSHQIAASGGVIEVLVEIHNSGTLPFRVTNLVLAASLLGDGDVMPVGNLDINTAFFTFVPYALAPGGLQGPVVFSKDYLTLDQMAALVQYNEGLRITVGVYELSDAAGKPYVFDALTIASRTATISIDYGGERPSERFLVATNLRPGDPGVRMDQVLSDILRIPFAADADHGLTSVRDLGGDAGGEWSVEQRHNVDDGDETTAYQAPYDFAAIRVFSGDVVRLSWAVH